MVALAVALRVFRSTVPREREFMREVLAPEASDGVITAGELEAMCGDHKARRTFRRAGGSRKVRRRNAHVLDAIADLADTLATSRGQDTAAVEFARGEVKRIRSGTPPLPR
ncbi:hypothetical protein ACFYVR_20240 [Rhodococcus sp. NPDC003318]|uniref:hypothetical protein n=1 Tax=Rhodococcus sp. NPDC003318 TaxID=3364503 RepID=UPI00368820F1